MKKIMNKAAHVIWAVSMYAGISVMLSRNVQAYIDPSIITYAVQIGAGVMVAVGAIVGVKWRRMKRKVSDKLGLDENAGKEVEADVVEIGEQEMPTPDA